MVDNNALLIEIWRRIARPVEISQAVEQIRSLSASVVPIDGLRLWLFDGSSRSLELLAWAGTIAADESAVGRVPIVPGDLDPLEAWVRAGQLTDATEDVARVLVCFRPTSTRIGCYFGPLRLERAGWGLVRFDLLSEQSDGASQQYDKAAIRQWLTALLEPLAAAVDQHQRLREIDSLRKAAEAERQALLAKLGRRQLTDRIIGVETGLRAVMERVELVAPSDVPVLIFGETGSGKEVIARAIHERSQCSSGPFLRVNCGAIPPELIDSQLFGHERGAFTGATEARQGWFERADGGTLLLDEIGELSLAAQVRLLRILQDGWFERVGGHRPIHVKVRIIAATHRDLASMAAEGRFREDLWYRLAVFPIVLPPLRERPGDIAAFARHFARRAALRFGLPEVMPTADDIRLLTEYPWPGNVRELAAVIDRAAILGNGKRLEIAAALGGTMRPKQAEAVATGPENAPRTGAVYESSGFSPRSAGERPMPTLDEAMRQHIQAALRACLGRIEGPSGAARLLGVNPHTLRGKMRRLGIDWKLFRPPR